MLEVKIIEDGKTILESVLSNPAFLVVLATFPQLLLNVKNLKKK